MFEFVKNLRVCVWGEHVYFHLDVISVLDRLSPVSSIPLPAPSFQHLPLLTSPSPSSPSSSPGRAAEWGKIWAGLLVRSPGVNLVIQGGSMSWKRLDNDLIKN